MKAFKLLKSLKFCLQFLLVFKTQVSKQTTCFNQFIENDESNFANFFRPRTPPSKSSNFETGEPIFGQNFGWTVGVEKVPNQNNQNLSSKNIFTDNHFLTLTKPGAIFNILNNNSAFNCLAFTYKIRQLGQLLISAINNSESGEKCVIFRRKFGTFNKWKQTAVPIFGAKRVEIVGKIGEISLDNFELFESHCLIEAEDDHLNRIPADFSQKLLRNKRDTLELPLSSLLLNRNNNNSSSVRYWPGRTIAYEIGVGFDFSQIGAIKRTLSLFNDTTCLRFIPRRDQGDYIHFSSSEGGCRAEVGYRANRTEVNLSDECFEFNGVKHIAHEVLHVLGLYHEHQRPDRDSYITIFSENILPGYLVNFEKIPQMDRRVLTTNYDFQSILHYSSSEYVRQDGLKSIVARNGQTMQLGNLVGPTLLDLQKVANIYCNGVLLFDPDENDNRNFIADFSPQNLLSENQKNSKVEDEIALWKNATIPYEFAPNLNASIRSIILSAMANLSQGSCVRFVERRQTDKNYVRLALGGQCSSNFGMGGFGRQTILLGPANGACITFARISRFLLLAAGVPYEHRRSDRDAYVTILYGNVSPAASLAGFTKLKKTDPRLLSVPYDYQSVLHWPNNYGSKDPSNLNTIEAIESPFLLLGNNNGPTSYDLEKLSRLYCPPALTSSKAPADDDYYYYYDHVTTLTTRQTLTTPARYKIINRTNKISVTPQNTNK